VSDCQSASAPVCLVGELRVLVQLFLRRTESFTRLFQIVFHQSQFSRQRLDLQLDLQFNTHLAVWTPVLAAQHCPGGGAAYSR